MALNLVSPGVTIREIDQTLGRIDPANNQVGGFAGPFEKGPVGEPILIDSEKSLLSVFGKPIDKNGQNEYWLSASNYLSYGGVLRVVRSDDTYLKNANVGTATTTVALKIKSEEDYINNAINDTNWVFAAKTPGTWANKLTVCVIDNFADQTITGVGTTGITVTSSTQIAAKTGDVGISTNTITGINTSSIQVGHFADMPTAFSDAAEIISIGSGSIILDRVSINSSIITGGSLTIEDIEVSFTPAIIQVGHGVEQQVTVSLPSLTGNPTAFTGKVRGIVTGVGKEELYVRIIDRVNAVTGAVEAIDYQKSISQANGYSFFPGNSIDIVTSSGTPVSSDISFTSAVDWYETQKLKLKNSTSLYWKSIAEKPRTTEYASERNSKNDEMHVVVVDDEGLISGTAGRILEKHLFLSKSSDNKSASESRYFVDYLANSSNYIYGGSSPANTVSGYAIGTGENTFTVQSGAWKTKTQSTYFNVIGSSSYVLDNGCDYGVSNNYDADITDVISAYETFRNPSEYSLDFIISGPSAASLFESQSKASAIISIANDRKDCIATISPHKSTVVNVANSSEQTDNILEFFGYFPSTSYAVFDSGYKYTYDRFNNKFLYLPCNPDIAGIMARTTTANYSWVSPGGVTKGSINNAVKLAYNPSQSQRDSLYNNRINPVVATPGQGIYLFGDKTALAYSSAFDRINVRRLFLTIEKAIEKSSRSLLFEFNDEITRNNFVNIVEPYLRDIKSKRGLSDFVVVCDTSNNTPDIIDSNQFVADIFVKPARSINFIGLTFVATKTGVSFSEIIGNV